MEKSHFWWFCWLGLGNPRHIATKTPLEKSDQTLGLADPHPPQLGQKTKFFDRSSLRAPLTLGSTMIFIALFQEEKKCNSPVCKAAGASLLPRIILLPASFFLHYLEISVYNRCKTKSVARSGFVMDWIIASKNQIRFLHHCWLASLSSKYISVQHLSASYRTSNRQVTQHINISSNPDWGRLEDNAE